MGRALEAAPAGAIGAPTRNPWRTLSPGVQTAAAADLGGDPAWAARVVLIDPRSAVLSVQFDADSPTIAQWRARFPGALAIANGSFYSADQPRGAVRPTCDLVLAGKVVRGAGCRRQDALFFGAKPAAQLPATARSEASATQPPATARSGASAARPANTPGAPDAGVPALRGARDGGLQNAPPAGTPRPGCAVPRSVAGPRLLSPADFRAEEWTEALKSFPALVHECQPACPGPHYCQERSRTAALAQLRDGKLVLFASQGPAVRREVGRFLAESLGAAEAVNLDGGPETTLSLRGEPLEDSIGLAGIGLPLVLVLLLRGP
jgi:Phosphodiester glycosidase